VTAWRWTFAHFNHDVRLTLENKPLYNAPAATLPARPSIRGSLGNTTRWTLLPGWRLKPLAAAIVAIGALAPGDDHAATLVVTTLAEASGTACTLRDAVNSVNAQSDQGQCVASGAYGAGDSVGFAPSLTGTITFFNKDPLSANPADASALVIRRPVAIEGPGSALLSLVCGSTSYRLLEVDAGVAAASLSGLTLANCGAVGSGGGILAGFAPTNVALTLQLTDVTLAGLRAGAGGLGGGLAAFDGNVSTTVTMIACNVSGNRALRGGGLAVSSSKALTAATVDVTDSVVVLNTATQSGGGAFVSGANAEVTFTRTTIDRNSVNLLGGGIEIELGEGTARDSTVSRNTAQSGGGVGLFGSGSRFSAINSTLSGNAASSFGGGIYAARAGANTFALANTTVASNKAGTGGGILVENSLSFGQTTLANIVSIVDTIVAGNVAPTDIVSREPQAAGGVLPWDVSFSVIGQSGTVPLVGTGNITDAAVPAPFGVTGWLGPLQNNGGPTLTHALLNTFPDPALDSGDPAFSGLAYDQRGKPFKRVQNGRVDIGAYEFRLAPTAGAAGAPVPAPRGWGLAALAALLGWLGWRLRPRR
jgi:hypothetical protein